jgi:hypothetical protein
MGNTWPCSIRKQLPAGKSRSGFSPDMLETLNMAGCLYRATGTRANPPYKTRLNIQVRLILRTTTKMPAK